MNRTIRTYTLYTIAAIICCSNFSCKKLIEIPANPTDRISTAQAFADSNNVLSVLAGIYNEFGIVDNGSAPGFYNGAMTIFTGLTSDELINRDVGLFPYMVPYFNNSLLPTDGYLVNHWQNAYKVIYAINVSLESIAISKGLSEGFKQQVTGELKTIRAWTYFNLLNLFGGVPLIVDTDFRQNAKLPRATEEETYALILSDLEEAATLLVPEYPSVGRARPNLFVAKALLAKIYLYRNSWQKAAELSGEVIDAGLYSLESDLNNVFMPGSNEAIWQYPGEDVTYSESNEGYNFIPGPGSFPDFEITTSLRNAFEPGDQRKVNWTNEIEVSGVQYIHPYKYKKKFLEDSDLRDGYVLLRFSEQYLTRAEARAHLDQNPGAVDDINLVRQRAGLNDISFSDQETLLDDIMQERRIELFAEWGNRWGDLKRTGRANAVLGVKPNWQPTDMLYPVPLFEIQTNPFLKQNPGY
jgi:starch-binding outer membrane protein, SusD/RagB family